jgi:hypothetical protein
MIDETDEMFLTRLARAADVEFAQGHIRMSIDDLDRLISLAAYAAAARSDVPTPPATEDDWHKDFL